MFLLRGFWRRGLPSVSIPGVYCQVTTFSWQGEGYKSLKHWALNYAMSCLNIHPKRTYTGLINSLLITLDITLNYLDDNNTSFTSGTWSMPENISEPQLKTSLIINGQSAQTESNNGAVTKPHPTHKASYINNTLAAQSRASHPGKGAQ